MPDNSSKYAIEGSAAHALAEECLLKNVSPHSYINGGTITLEDDDGGQIEYEVTPNMSEAVIRYTKMVNDLCLSLGVELSEDNIESRFHLDWIDEEIWGTNDFNVAIPFDTLHTYDYKHGQGVAVDVQYPEPVTYYSGGKSDKNPQLMIYSLGAVGPTNEHFVTDVELGVVQPRASHPDGRIRTARLSIEELFAWRDEVLIPGIAETRKPNAPLCDGDHCRFCKAIAICPQVGTKAVTVAGSTAAEVFSDKPVVFPLASEMTQEQRVQVCEFIGLFESWAKEVIKDTHARVLNGEPHAGLKVVQQLGNRSWINAEQAQQVCVGELGTDAYVPPKLKSPTQITKALKDINADPALIEPMVQRVPKRVVVPESDKRPALPVGAAEVDWNNNNPEGGQ